MKLNEAEVAWLQRMVVAARAVAAAPDRETAREAAHRLADKTTLYEGIEPSFPIFIRMCQAARFVTKGEDSLWNTLSAKSKAEAQTLLDHPHGQEIVLLLDDLKKLVGQ